MFQAENSNWTAFQIPVFPLYLTETLYSHFLIAGELYERTLFPFQGCLLIRRFKYYDTVPKQFMKPTILFYKKCHFWHFNEKVIIIIKKHLPLHNNILVYNIVLQLKWVYVQQVDVTTLSTKKQTVCFHWQWADRDLFQPKNISKVIIVTANLSTY